MKDIKIIGSGYAIAKHRITNFDLEKVIDTSDEWITSRTGISSRYVSSDENTSDLAYRAAQQAIANASLNVKEIDLIVVATMTPDHFTPATACLLQEKLGLNDCQIMAFDINAACSGFLYAMYIASNMLNDHQCALVVGSETLSKLIDWQDRNTCVLFGDGAGAMLLKKISSNKVMNYYAQSIGDNKGILQANGIALNEPLHNHEKNFGYLQMDGSEVFRFAIKAMQSAIFEVLKKANQSIDAIDLIIPHQANLRIIKNVAKRMKLTEDKFYVNLDRYGNTSAASVAIAYAQAMEEGKLRSGMKIVLVAFGAGFTYAASYIEL
ncbi:MAG: ketoacyl-ACP synthase III [Bacilli bacterium]|nr:ketoacyl-ACP synthase III [Bacilli bacterium]